MNPPGLVTCSPEADRKREGREGESRYPAPGTRTGRKEKPAPARKQLEQERVALNK